MRTQQFDRNLEWLMLLLGIVILLFILVLDTQAQPRLPFPRQTNAAAENTSIRHGRFRGQVVKIDGEHSRLTVKHEPVPELEMETMTMPFLVKERDALTGLKVGDVITATIYEERESGRMWLENVAREEAPAKNNQSKSARKKINKTQ